VGRLARLLALLLMGATLGVTGPMPFSLSIALADHRDDEARKHFRVATALYDSGRFSEAANEFRLAHELSQRPQLLYNLFLASRDAGEIPEAAAALRQYLAQAEEVKDREVLEARLKALEKIVAERTVEPDREQPEAAPEPVADSEPAEAQLAAVPAPVEQAQEPRRLNWLPWTLLGSGVGLVAAGGTLGYLGVQDEQKLKDSNCGDPKTCSLTDREVEDLKSDGKFKTVLGDALWIPGAVTAAVGLTLLLWKPWEKTDGAETTPRVDVACGSKSCGAILTGRF
jgi:tetratricopeptide (TPR) repeat protein